MTVFVAGQVLTAAQLNAEEATKADLDGTGALAASEIPASVTAAIAAAASAASAAQTVAAAASATAAADGIEAASAASSAATAQSAANAALSTANAALIAAQAATAAAAAATAAVASASGPGVAKAWVNFSGTSAYGTNCTIRSSHGVERVEHPQVGLYIVYFATALSTADFAWFPSGRFDDAAGINTAGGGIDGTMTLVSEPRGNGFDPTRTTTRLVIASTYQEATGNTFYDMHTVNICVFAT